MTNIDYSRLRTVTAHDITRALMHDGFVQGRQRGSHHRYVHSDGRRVTVAFTRRGDTFELNTLRSIIEVQAKWTNEDLRRVRLL